MTLTASDPAAYDIVTWESWIKAGRLTIYSGWLEKQIIDLNHALSRKGWQDVKIVYVTERTTWLDRRILFKIEGQRYAILVFQEALAELSL